MEDNRIRHLGEEHERRNFEQARRHHDDLIKLGLAYLSSAVTMASDAIKAAAVANGGPAAALLAFLGTGRSTATALSVTSLGVFAAGFLCASCASVLGYFAQLNYGNEQMERVRTFEHPYVKETEESVASRARALRFHRIGLVFVLAAFALAMLGMALAMIGFRSTNVPPNYYSV